MTADQIRSLRPGVGCAVGDVPSLFGAGLEFQAPAGVRAGSDGRFEAEEHLTDRVGRWCGGADAAGVSLLSGLGPRDGERSSPSRGDGPTWMRPGDRRNRRLRTCQTEH